MTKKQWIHSQLQNSFSAYASWYSYVQRVLSVSTRAIACLFSIKTNTLARLSSSEEAENVEARVTDTVEEDRNDIAD